jgi:hypothetical protein
MPAVRAAARMRLSSMVDQTVHRSALKQAVSWLETHVGFESEWHQQLPDWAWRLRHRGWLAAREQPQLFYALARKRGFAQNQLVGPGTELVIEGFPRSANSYAVIGFQLAQTHWRSVAHHTHAPAQIIRATERAIPLIVPIRHPRDAVASLLIRDPRYTVDLALEAYESFHETILPYRDSMVLARFEDIIGNLGGVVERVNRQFGTTFVLPSSDAESRAACFRLIEQIDAQSGGNERTVARPSSWRQERKREVVTRVQDAHRYPEVLSLYEDTVAQRVTLASQRSRVIVLSAAS